MKKKKSSKRTGRGVAVFFLFLFVIGLVLVALTLIAMAYGKGIALAETRASVENGTFVLRETKELARVPKVPKELLNKPDVLKQLFTGQLKETMIGDQFGKRSYSIAFPLIRQEVVYSDKTVTFKNSTNSWSVIPAPKFSERNSYFFTFFWLWVTAVLIMKVSIINSLSGAGTKRLLSFYATMFTGVGVGNIMNIIGGDTEVSTLAGMVCGALAGMLSGMFVGTKKKFPDIGTEETAPGRLLAAFAGGIIGSFAGGASYEVVAQYCLFLLAVCAVSFGFVWFFVRPERDASI